MGLFGSGLGLNTKGKQRLPLDLLSRHECRLCTLDKANLYSPKMQPTGSDHPVVYMLGEAPGYNEDQQGEQFVGEAGSLLRPLIPAAWKGKIRWNNSIRCWPGRGNPDPTEVQLACCRPSIIRDIEACKPKAIFSFGNVPLQWLIGQTGITIWRGRYAPVKVGSHTTWAFFFLHPAFIKRKGRNGLSEEERVFKFDLERAFSTLTKLDVPSVHDKQSAVMLHICGGSNVHLRQIIEFLDKSGTNDNIIGIDYETYPLRPYAAGASILSAAVSTEHETLAFAWHHPEAQWTKDQLQQIEQAWIKFLRSPCRKAVHNLSFEQEWSAYLWGWDIIRASRWEDTLSQAFVLDERVGGFSLEFLVLQHFGLNIKQIAGLNRKDLRNEPIQEVLKYNATDAYYHRNLYSTQQLLLRHAQLEPQYEDMLRRITTCVLTQLRGVPTDPTTTSDLSRRYEGEIADIAREIEAMPEARAYQRKYHEEYNPGSPKRVIRLCQGILGANVHSEKDNKDHSDEDVLSQLDLPITNATLQYKKKVKLKSTYVDAITKHLWPDGLLHQNLNTCFVRTSRSSSDDPNLQNIPNRSAEGKEVRKQIKAPPGHLIAKFDAAQIQARNVAMESKDPIFTKMLWEEYDIHGEWARKVATACPDLVGGRKNLNDTDIMKKFRNDMKSWWTFALLFGASFETVCDHHLHAPKHIIEPLYDEWWQTFSGVKDWQERITKQYHEIGYVENLTGIRRRAPIRQNQLINAPIQADEAAIIFDAFNRLSEIGDPVLQPVMEIHDDLTFILPKDKFDNYAEIIIDEMLRCTFDWINCPLGVEMAVGENWYDMKAEGVFWSHLWHNEPKRPHYA